MANFSYIITSLNTNVCNKIITPGGSVSVSWSMNSFPEFAKCYVAVRPVSNLHDDGAYVAGDKHPLSFEQAVNFVIPDKPINASYPFNGTDFLVRISADNLWHADSCSFKIQGGYKPPLSLSDKIATASVAVASVAAFLSVLIGVIAIIVERQRRGSGAQQQQPNNTTLQQQPNNRDSHQTNP